MVNNTMKLLRSLEPPAGSPGGRLLDDASGGRGFGCGAGWVDPNKCPQTDPASRCMAVFWSGGCQSDVVDHHHYPQPVVPYDLADIAAQQGKAFLLGEYGGISVDVPKHMWNSSCDRAVWKKGTSDGGRISHPLPRRALMRSVGVQASGEGIDEGGEEGSKVGGDPNSLGATFTRYNEMVGQGLLAKGLAGQIFTQITDIECERNGLLTYDRAVHKADWEVVAAANAALLRNATRMGVHADHV